MLEYTTSFSAYCVINSRTRT